MRQRVVNLVQAGDADSAAYLLFDFLQNSWNGAREPLGLDVLPASLIAAAAAARPGNAHPAPCDPERYAGLGVEGWHASCRENLEIAMRELGHERFR